MNFKVLTPLLILGWIGWFQPWETPKEKIGDEWQNCLSTYNGQCYYIGDKFKTNSVEMFVSELFHDTYDDKECERSSRNVRL